MLVDFMLVGAQKAGTTALASQLAEHPQIAFSSAKEPAYFNERADWRSGLDSYHQLYQPVDGQLLGEASTMYTFFPEYRDTHNRLHAYNPDLKVIYIMRQPVNRIISHYSHNLVRGLEREAPENAVHKDPRYVNRSRYAVQIRPYIDLFGLQRILLLTFEDYISDQERFLRQVANFLGIAADGFVDDNSVEKHKTVGVPYLKSEKVEKLVGTDTFQALRTIIPAAIRQPIRYKFFSNKMESKPEFSTEMRESLWALVEDDVFAIESMLNRRLDSWRSAGNFSSDNIQTVLPEVID